VDEEGRAFRRRVDPPEALFAALAQHGLRIPRAAGGDDDLARAERLAPGLRPPVATVSVRPAAGGATPAKAAR
jgi:hypothetical protein